jgi:hypothetical protein
MKITLQQLWESATRLAAWRRNYSQSPRRQINQIVPFVGTKTILFTGSFNGLTENSVHLSNILIMDCEIIEEVKQAPIKPNIHPQIKPQINPPSQQSNPNAPSQPNNTQVTQQPNVNTVQNQPPARPYGGVINAEPNYSTRTHFKVTYNNVNYWVKKIDMKKQHVLVRCSCSDYYFVWSWANYKAGVQFGGRARPYIRKTKTYPPRNPANIVGGCKHIMQFAQMLQTSGYAI